MKDPARLIIPVWGERYMSKVLSITVPAILAPGNLPARCEKFQVELVIVTESRLFDMVEASTAFQRAAKIYVTRLIPLDDLLTDVPSDYGMVLTYALFRGFADLGARVTETYLIRLNAVFIISDGSLRHLGKLMSEGHRVIHAPSFRVVLEDVWPHVLLRQLVSPDVDVSEIHIFWKTITTFLRLLHLKASQSFPGCPVIRALTVCAALILLAPAVWLAKTRAARHDTSIFTRAWKPNDRIHGHTQFVSSPGRVESTTTFRRIGA
jgi:hypothetical protein